MRAGDKEKGKSVRPSEVSIDIEDIEADSDADDDFDSVIEDFMNLPDLELPPDSPRSILHVPQPVEDIFDIFLNGP